MRRSSHVQASGSKWTARLAPLACRPSPSCAAARSRSSPPPSATLWRKCWWRSRGARTPARWRRAGHQRASRARTPSGPARRWPRWTRWCGAQDLLRGAPPRCSHNDAPVVALQLLLASAHARLALLRTSKLAASRLANATARAWHGDGEFAPSATSGGSCAAARHRAGPRGAH